MPYTVANITSDVQTLMSGRSFPPAQLNDWTVKVIWELSESYDFQGLEILTPFLNFNFGQVLYTPAQFINITGIQINQIKSIFVFINAGIVPTNLTITTGQNAGYKLGYKSPDSIEPLFNISGIPRYWSRFNGNVAIAFSPDNTYYYYCRVVQEHQFPAFTVDPTDGSDTILLDDSWRDIISYCVAHRAANSINLNERATTFHNMVYGDPKFQLSGGKEGAPGLIFMRTSQRERDQETGMKSLRVMTRKVMR